MKSKKKTKKVEKKSECVHLINKIFPGFYFGSHNDHGNI